MIHIIDEVWGIYVPQVFAKRYEQELLAQGISQDDIDFLKSIERADPEDADAWETYWEIWDNILRDVKIDGMSLHQDGGVFLDNDEELEEDL